ncbi:MAG: response regulator [Candidatus Dormiibacterota bacterium]
MYRSVLIVDDDPVFSSLVGRILADLGVEAVAIAADARQALDAVQDSRPDAVLVDVGLPDRDGIDLAYELAELPWGPRIVVTSSDSEAFVAIEARAGQPTLPFIAKQELAGDSLRHALTL